MTTMLPEAGVPKQRPMHDAGVRMYYTMTFGHLRPDLWRDRPGVPVMVVASNYLGASGTLRVRRAPVQCRPVFCDSGGFAVKGGDYSFSYDHYLAWGHAMAPDAMACWDHPCDLADDHAVRIRQARTLAHACTLLARDVPWAWVPVVQGRTVAQYARHAAMYRAADALTPYMGIGSLVGRTQVAEVATIVRALADEAPAARWHLFGVKAGVLRQGEALPACVKSVDTSAWNGGFMTARTQRAAAYARGLTQAQYELHEALPRYQAKVRQALAQPKQLHLLEVPA